MKSQRKGHRVSWLRRTEYISSDYRQFQNLGIGTENKVGLGARKKLQNKDIYKDRESQIEAIENTFEAATHTVPNRKNGVYPVESCPIYPDFEYWKYPFSQVAFDTKPFPIGFDENDLLNLDKKMDNAMIRGKLSVCCTYYTPSISLLKYVTSNRWFKFICFCFSISVAHNMSEKCAFAS